MILIILSWLIVGIISAILLFAVDLRGEEYNESYFEGMAFPTFAIFVCGCFSLIFVFLAYNNKYKFLQRLIYKIVNIGVNKKAKKDDMRGIKMNKDICDYNNPNINIGVVDLDVDEDDEYRSDEDCEYYDD